MKFCVTTVVTSGEKVEWWGKARWSRILATILVLDFNGGYTDVRSGMSGIAVYVRVFLYILCFKIV
jgi:hypothetical protein